MTRNKKIAAVVVAYNPDVNILAANILTYAKYVDCIIIVNNGSSPLGLKGGFGGKIIIIENSRNMGVATALNIGIRRAITMKYSFFLTMDQDSSFDDDKYFVNFNAGKYAHAGIVGIKNNPMDISSGVSSPDYVITSGSIIRKDVFAGVGGFTDKLFIDEVDHDFCLMARRKGFSIIREEDCLLTHALGKKTTAKLFGKKISYHDPFRKYFIVRNGLYMTRKYLFRYPRASFNRFFFIFTIIKNTILFETNRMESFRCMFKGVVDFIASRYGNPFDTKKT